MPRISQKRLPKPAFNNYILFMKFQRPNPDLFFSKGDILDPRLGDLFKFSEDASSVNDSFALIGYPDDEGIRNNGGRLGAKEGPYHIRRWLYRMTQPPITKKCLDMGDLEDFENQTLEIRHQYASEKAFACLSQNAQVLTFGGGHDYGFADGSAFLKWADTQKEKPLIINFDAHLDVRDLKYGVTSGTPFFRLKSADIDFDLIQVGIQSQCNSFHHLEWCEKNHIHVLPLEDFIFGSMNLRETLKSKFGGLLTQKRATFLSVDIDGFAWPYAIGSSQSWPTGIEPRDFFPAFDFLLEHLNVKMLSIYEVSPPLDIQGGTSKLAAQIAYRYLQKS